MSRRNTRVRLAPVGHVREQRFPLRATSSTVTVGPPVPEVGRGVGTTGGTAGRPRACAPPTLDALGVFVPDEETDNVGIAIQDLGPGDLIDVAHGPAHRPVGDPRRGNKNRARRPSAPG